MSSALLRVKTAAETSLWVAGIGEVDRNHANIIKRLTDYDEKLMLAKHEYTGDWCVFLKPRANPYNPSVPFPVLGLGRELPDVEHVMQKLIKFDALRNGEKQLDEMEAHNRKAREMVDEAAADASGYVAEAVESYMHDHNKTPYHRSLRKVKQTAIKGH